MPKAMRDLDPLPIEDPSARWLIFSGGELLHRVSDINWLMEYINGEGVTVCGRVGFLYIPGPYGRTITPRCPACCKRLGIPEGVGNSYNEGMDL